MHRLRLCGLVNRTFLDTLIASIPAADLPGEAMTGTFNADDEW